MASLRFAMLINKKEISARPKTSITAIIVSNILSFATLNKSSDGSMKYNFFKNNGTVSNYISFDGLRLIR